MRRINDPLVLRELLARLSSEPLTPAQARLLLASKGIRAERKALEEVLRLMRESVKKTQQTRLKSLDGLPLTPEERAIMERLRRQRASWATRR